MKKVIVLLLLVFVVVGCNLSDELVGTWIVADSPWGDDPVGVVYSFNDSGTVNRDGILGTYTVKNDHLVLVFGGVVNPVGKYSIHGDTMTWVDPLFGFIREILTKQ